MEFQSSILSIRLDDFQILTDFKTMGDHNSTKPRDHSRRAVQLIKFLIAITISNATIT